MNLPEETVQSAFGVGCEMPSEYLGCEGIVKIGCQGETVECLFSIPSLSVRGNLNYRYSEMWSLCWRDLHRDGYVVMECLIIKYSQACLLLNLEWKLSNPTLVRISNCQIRKVKCIENTHLCTEIVSDRDIPGLDRCQIRQVSD